MTDPEPTTLVYTCPMHPEIQSDQPGHCPECGMDLIRSDQPAAKDRRPTMTSTAEETSYRPLAVIIGLIALAALVLGIRDANVGIFSWVNLMAYFEAGFFLTFAGFKLIDVKGFAQGYFTYDLLAKRIFGYGLIYPFIELGLGLAYLIGVRSVWLFALTFVVMGFSGLGVLNSMIHKKKFQCACLGTFLKVPLSKVTLVEDFGMAFLSLLMLLGFK